VAYKAPPIAAIRFKRGNLRITRITKPYTKTAAHSTNCTKKPKIRIYIVAIGYGVSENKGCSPSPQSNLFKGKNIVPKQTHPKIKIAKPAACSPKTQIIKRPEIHNRLPGDPP
jgi:hypothetical protein